MGNNNNGVCGYNRNVLCWSTDCERCGWNPAEMAQRMLRIERGEMVSCRGLKTLKIRRGEENKQEDGD